MYPGQLPGLRRALRHLDYVKPRPNSMVDSAQPPGNRLQLESVVRASKNQASCELSDEIVILDMASGVYFGLDHVGSRVWEHLREALPVRRIHSALLDEFDVDSERCQKDLLALLGELREAGLIEVLDEGAA